MAVFTKLTKSEIALHLQNYAIGELLDFQEILQGIDNSNFIIQTSQDKFILTIFESRLQVEDLPYFVNLKLHLAKKGICCPRPIVNNQGLTISDLKGKKSAIVSFLSGKTLTRRDDGYYDNITAKHCFEVGKVTAKMHQAVSDFSLHRKNDLGISGWRPLFKRFEHLLENYQKNLRDEILENLDFLEKNWRFDFPLFTSHVDLFPDNVFFDEKQNLTGVIDFYFAADEALIYDLAVLVNSWCFDEKDVFSSEKFTQILQGYEEIRKLSLAEKDFLKIALIGAAMRFLLTRLHDMFFTPKDSLIKIKNPQEYLTKLRFFRKSKDF